MNYTKLLLSAFLILLFACKKSDNNTSEPDNNIDPSDSKSLFQNIKINHGEKIDGVLPTPSANGPILDEEVANQTLPSIAGKYAVIHPEVISGEIAGYYARITGYSEAYFKVDFSKPISGRHKAKLSKRFNPTKKVMDDNPDYVDSVIVIRLPDNIKPGTFCMEYIAYDWDNNTSNIVKQCITVSTLGGEEKLTGKWSMEKTKYSVEDWDYYPYLDTSLLTYYSCDVNNVPFQVYDSTAGVYVVPALIRKYDYSEWEFSSNGSGREVYNEIELTSDFTISTCDNIKYTSEEDVNSSPFIWSFDSVRKKLIMIYDYEKPEYIFFIEFDITFINQDRFSIHYLEVDGNHEEWGEFVRIP